MKRLAISLFLILSLTLSQAQAIDILGSGQLTAINQNNLTVKLGDQDTKINITLNTKFLDTDDKTLLSWNKFNKGEVISVLFDSNTNNAQTVKKGPIILKMK